MYQQIISCEFSQHIVIEENSPFMSLDLTTNTDSANPDFLTN